MHYARRRSAALKTLNSTSPKSTVSGQPALRQRVIARPPNASRLTAPLPSTMLTGRHSAPTPSTSRNISVQSSRVPKPTTSAGPSNRPPVASTIIRRGPLNGTNSSAAATSKARILPKKVSLPSRPLSELAQLKEKIARMENEKEEQMKRFETTKMELDKQLQLVEMQKEQIAAKDLALEQMTASTNFLSEQLNEKETILRKLHNDVVDLRGQIRVAIRVRPILKSEEAASCADVIEYPSVNAISIHSGSKPSRVFAFEKVFTHVFSQKNVFESLEDFILSALHGFNVGLIAFGQTGSGKTHTMRGGNGDEEGIIPRAASFLFKESEKLKSFGWEFQFSLSFLEIYNKEAYDLLNNRATVKIRLSNETVVTEGLSQHPLEKLSDLSGMLRLADGQRMTATTKCNEYSSRSHAIYTWNIKAHQKTTGISTTSKLKLVDLAGSERAKESGVTGAQFKEMTNINQSLSVLKKCVNMQKCKAPHVPYRDSKLTEVLMDCLGRGNSKTMVLVNLNPCNEQAIESKRSLEFASTMRETQIGAALQQRDL